MSTSNLRRTRRNLNLAAVLCLLGDTKTGFTIHAQINDHRLLRLEPTKTFTKQSEAISHVEANYGATPIKLTKPKHAEILTRLDKIKASQRLAAAEKRAAHNKRSVELGQAYVSKRRIAAAAKNLAAVLAA